MLSAKADVGLQHSMVDVAVLCVKIVGLTSCLVSLARHGSIIGDVLVLVRKWSTVFFLVFHKYSKVT